MEIKNWAVIDTLQNINGMQPVINVIAWDGDTSNYDIHAGHGVSGGLIAIQNDYVGIGFLYDGNTFINPNSSTGE